MTRTLRSAAAALSLLIAPLLALPACAQQPAAQPPAQAAGQAAQAAARPAAANDNDADPALWVVKDEDTTVYLFGTVHVLKPGLTWFDEAVKDAFDASGELVLEIVEPDQQTMARLVAAKGINAAGPALSTRIPASKRAVFGAAVAASGVPAAAVDRMDPWLAGVTLSLAPLAKLGYDPANGPETVLTAAAKAGAKQVVALETAEQQLGYFDGLSDASQMQFLLSTLDDLPKVGDELGKMVADWSRGDPDALAAVLNENLKDTPEVARVLLFERNARWAGWIKARMARPGTVFVAVGAGHLAGKDDVQEQLAKLGVKTERVRY